MIWFFLLSGLFLGWSLGANDGANIFGTAVGTRMVRFRTAALVAGAGVILGAAVGGGGTTATIASLGAVSALPGSFTVALAAGATVAAMTRSGIPVSSTHAIVGAILGWNFFTHSATDTGVLITILTTWLASPLLAAVVAVLLYWGTRRVLARNRVHMLELDAYTRAGLIVIGAFGAYSLGANNIGNVMGVFVTASPFGDVSLGSVLTISGTQQLFLLGGIAIAVGIYTWSDRVIATVGGDLFKLTPLPALIVVSAHSLVLFVFSSEQLRDLLSALHLPTLPLVPVSSSQAIVGAILGLALAKGGVGVIRYAVLGKVALGWVLTPLLAGVCTYIALFFVQNVFEQEVIATAQTLAR